MGRLQDPTPSPRPVELDICRVRPIESRMMAGWIFFLLFPFCLFLLGFSVFMYFEERKFGDNQFSVKLLPPPMAYRASLAHGLPSLEIRHADPAASGP